MNASSSETLTKLTSALLASMLEARLNLQVSRFLSAAHSEISRGTSQQQFARLFSMCSRYAQSRIKLVPSEIEITQAASLLNGWNPERWTLLEAMRVSLLLAWPNQNTAGAFDEVFEHCFTYADEGEVCALYRALPLLCENSGGEKRFLRRATEGCRSNMLSIFEAVACDSQYPFLHFDSLSWNQLIMKAVFMDVPLWRILGLDQRLSPSLSQMVLDLIDERRSAGRPIPPQLWICFGENTNQDVLATMQEELAAYIDNSSATALILAFARAGELDTAKQLINQKDSELCAAVQLAERGEADQYAFANL